MSGLRVAMLTTFYPPYNFGGDGIGIRRFSMGLAALGHQVTVIHDRSAYDFLNQGATPEPMQPDNGVEVISLGGRTGMLPALVTQQTGRPGLRRKELQRILRDGAFDVINYHNISLLGGCGAYELGDAVKVHMAHDHWLVCPSHVLWRHGRELCDERECLRCVISHRRPPQLWRATGLVERKGRHVDAFIAMSKFSADKHKEMGFPFPMKVLPYFLPEPNPTPTQSEPVHPNPFFLFVGRLEAIKGLDEVIDLFRTLPEQELLIAGDGNYRASLEARADGCENVHFLGRLEAARLDACYQQSQALIVPSLCYETFGIILIEAFRHGTPVIARRLGPFPEIVESAGAGDLFSTSEELRNGVMSLADNPKRRDELGAAGRCAFKTRYSESVVMPQYMNLIADAAMSRGRDDIAEAALNSIRAGSETE